MQDKKIVVKKKCPYCFMETTNEDIGFLLRTDGAKFISPAMNEITSPKKDIPYAYFWSSMGVAEEQIDAERTIIDNQMISELNQELSAAGRELAVKHFDNDSLGYSFSAQEGAVTLYSNSMICPHCHNVLPQNFFKYDMMQIGLAGSVNSGKTVYLSSLMMDDFNALQRDNLMVRNAAGNTGDAYRLEMEKNADMLRRKGICPAATNKVFRKPFFMELAYQIEDKTFHLIVALYDVAGELMKEDVGSGRTGFVRHMDGYICTVDPMQMHLSHSLINKQIPDEDRILKKLHLMTQEEQILYQKMSNDHGKQVMDQNDFMIENAVSDDYISGRKAENVLDAIRSGLGETSLADKYMAVTLTKSDLLEEIEEIRSYPASSLLFERSNTTYGFFNMDHHFIRQQVLEQIFDQKVFRVQRNLQDYKQSSLFAVSALGCETEMIQEGAQEIVKAVGNVQPIRVEEPLLWLVMKYMQERGWLE